MTVPHLYTSAENKLRHIGFEANGDVLKVSHYLTVAVLSKNPSVAYARMDNVYTKPFDSSDFRDVIAQLSGRGVLGVVYDFENYSHEAAIRFTLDNIIPSEQNFNLKRFCFSPSFGSGFHENLLDYFGSASREGDQWTQGNLKEVLERMIVRVQKNLVR